MSLAQFEPKKIYIRVQGQPITTAGIYHNSDLGLISLSSDGSNWITIADKNLGATQVYNYGDTMSETNCGKFYQRGNNYGFPFNGPTTTSSSQVNAQNCGPSNYYSSSTFRYRSSSPYYWDSSDNADLRGNTTNTNIARKGPCDEGFHIPSKDEMQSLYDIGANRGIWGNSGAEGIATYLYIPHCGAIRYSDAGIMNRGILGFCWTSTPYTTGQAYYLVGNLSTNTTSIASQYKSMGFSIRPFKNEVVKPDDSRTVLYQPS